jgi:hypothetical protein
MRGRSSETLRPKIRGPAGIIKSLFPIVEFACWKGGTKASLLLFLAR